MPANRRFSLLVQRKFGLKPVFPSRIMLIYRTAREGRPWVFISFKQIYADQYIASSLGVAV